MEARGVPKTLWSANINPLLNSNCKQALLSLLSEEQGSWDSVEHALLLTLGAKYRQAAQQFFKLDKTKQTFQQYVKQLTVLFDRMTHEAQTYSALREIIIAEHFISTFPYKCQSYIREKKINTIMGAVEEAHCWFTSNRQMIYTYVGNCKWADSKVQLKQTTKIVTRTVEGPVITIIRETTIGHTRHLTGGKVTIPKLSLTRGVPQKVGEISQTSTALSNVTIVGNSGT